MKKLNRDINIHTSSRDIYFYVDSGTKGQLLLNIIYNFHTPTQLNDF